MKALLSRFLLPVFLFISITAQAQFDPGKVLRVEDGKLIFTIDLNWNESQRQEISRLFDFDSLLYGEILKNLPSITVDSITWQFKIIRQGVVEVSKSISEAASNYPRNDVVLVNTNWIKESNRPQAEVPVFGINKFTNRNAFQYSGGVACFFLSGNPGAKVYISGSFNSWSTMQDPMLKTDSGWILKKTLSPGKYTYKYIINGRWTPDPDNKNREDDTYNSHNSVVYCYNHTFRLNGYPDARNVLVSGSFNDWNENELKMNRTGSGWELPVFLREGTHAYKFIVDRQWMLDPGNPITHPDGRGHENSFMAIGDTTFFRLQGFESAESVMLAGNFNAWNPGELKMEKVDGGWLLPYVLAKGNYEYKFVVDGKWISDPANPYSSGSGQEENSFFSFKPNHTFVLDSFPEARQVIVTGDFSGWNTQAYRMSRENGRWEFPITLTPGKHTYKFIVDGKWLLDPGNELWEENEYGTYNSMVWIL